MHAPRRFTLFGLLLALVGANGAWAASPAIQGSTSPQSTAAPKPGRTMPDPQRQTTRLSRKLQLTPDQAAKIEPILQNRQQQMQQIRSDTSLTPRDLHQKIRALRQGTDGQILTMLTDTQRTQYLQLQQTAMQKHRSEKRDASPSTPADGDNDEP